MWLGVDHNMPIAWKLYCPKISREYVGASMSKYQRPLSCSWKLIFLIHLSTVISWSCHYVNWAIQLKIVSGVFRVCCSDKYTTSYTLVGVIIQHIMVQRALQQQDQLWQKYKTFPALLVRSSIYWWCVDVNYPCCYVGEIILYHLNLE